MNATAMSQTTAPQLYSPRYAQRFLATPLSQRTGICLFKRKSTVARENCTHPKGIEYVKYVGGYELSDGGFHATFSCRCPVCFTEIPLTCSGSKEYVEKFPR